MIKPILFTVDGCLTCYKAKKHLFAQEIEYNEVNIFDDFDQIRKLKEASGEIITPVLLINNQVYKKEEIYSIKLAELCEKK